MKKILLASDGSNYSDEAASLVARLPHDEPLEVTVATILNIPATHRTSISREWVEQCISQEDDRAKEIFAKIQSMFEGANVKLTHVVQEGHVGSTLVKIAEKENPDLLVIGAKGRSTVNRLLLGSVSDHVATHASCSVLVVRPTSMHQSKRPMRLAIAYEGTEAARLGLDEICEIDWGAEPDVHLVLVLPATLPYSEEQRRFDHDALEKASKRVRTVALTVQTEVVENDHFGDGLVNYIEQNECDIIVVSESQRGRLNRLLLGSVSRFVLRHAPCSVWVTRNHET